MLETAASVRSHDDQVGAPRPRLLDDHFFHAPIASIDNG